MVIPDDYQPRVVQSSAPLSPRCSRFLSLLAWTAAATPPPSPGPPSTGAAPTFFEHGQRSFGSQQPKPAESGPSDQSRPNLTSLPPPGTRGPAMEWHQTVNSNTYINNALQGCDTNGDPVHKRCTHMRGETCCYAGIWSTRDALKEHLAWFTSLSQEARTEHVFQLQSGMRWSNKWVYFVNGVEVCRLVFLLYFPIHASTLTMLQYRLEHGYTTAHPKRNPGELLPAAEDCTRGARSASVVGWYDKYASTCGDYMPDTGKLIVPRRTRKEEWDEYKADLGDDAVSYETFCKVVRISDGLTHVKRARAILNFQKCTTCVNLDAKVKTALATRPVNHALRSEAFAERRAHHLEQKAERLAYYKKRELGRKPEESECCSLILDKWDSAKTTVPYFARHPGAWWSTLRKIVLKQSVTGVIVHGVPNNHFLFTANASIKGDANLNIECIRRTLAEVYASSPMPKTLYVQSDNASDNKCWTMLAFFAMMVHHSYVSEVFFSFLLVGHTHEDIDQFFSSLSKFLKRDLTRVTTPSKFQEGIQQAMGNRAYGLIEPIDSVFDWIKWFEPYLLDTGDRAVGIHEAYVDDEIHKPHHFWIHKKPSGDVVFHYKELATDPVWLPSTNPDEVKVSDPNGIPIFKRPPPDPMMEGASPREAPFASD